MSQAASVPVVMAFSGLDPTGGAGIQADTEAIASMGCHAAPVITAITVQDTTNVYGFTPQSAALVIQQARAVLEDMPVAVFKLGFTGSIHIIEAIHTILTDYPHVPVVLDPLLRAGGGRELADAEMVSGIKALLLPHAAITTPNTHEARVLAAEADNLSACAMAMLDQGTEHVLITGTHEDTHEVINTLYGGHRMLHRFQWERLRGSYHGSGCTLAAAISGLLAHGHEVVPAADKAQEFTWNSLRHGYRPGVGQWLPNRLFWAGGH